jgi:hypothetical protein
MRERINDFNDDKCTCQCGNTHELYGGVGYSVTDCQGYSDGQVDGGFYRAKYQCNQCGSVKVVQH